MFLAKIYVTLKPTVNDPQGLTVMGGLENLGFDSVEKVRVGKYIELWVKETEQAKARESVEEMCRQLLSNPIIEDFRFELEEQA